MKKIFFVLAVVSWLNLGVCLPAWSQNEPPNKGEYLFASVTKIFKKHHSNTNTGTTYDFSITGMVNGQETTINVSAILPDDPRAEEAVLDFCEKAALLTKSNPDKHDLFVKLSYNYVGSGDASNTTTSRTGPHELQCELR